MCVAAPRVAARQTHAAESSYANRVKMPLCRYDQEVGAGVVVWELRGPVRPARTTTSVIAGRWKLGSAGGARCHAGTYRQVRAAMIGSNRSGRRVRGRCNNGWVVGVKQAW